MRIDAEIVNPDMARNYEQYPYEPVSTRNLNALIQEDVSNELRQEP